MHSYRQHVAVLLQCLWITLLAALAATLLASRAAAQPAQPAGPAQPSANHIAAELTAESAVPAGGTVTLAFHMRPQPGWHGYWLNPGDAGLGMDVAWQLPPGATAGALHYPVPDTLVVSGLMNHVFKGDYAVLVDVRVPAGLAAGQTLPVSADARWLACTDEICVPERARLSTVIRIGPRGTADSRFDGWRARLPAPLGAQGRFTATGTTIRIGIPLPAAMALEAPHFFPAEDKVAEYATPQRFSRKGDLLIVELKRPAVAPADPPAISGVLRLNRAGDGVLVKAAPGAVPTGGAPLADATGNGAPAASLPLLLLAALAGGLLLNVMPCVFPILSLKALSLARAGESAAQARAEGLAYTAGVVIACIGLGGLLLVLRAAGEEVGWAFQLQEPGVVAVLLLLATAITANFLGLFEFAVPGFASEGSPQGAFATGLLAAFVATPCTGPFMAAAMGAALLLPTGPALALFATLGLGIALPFLAIAVVPGLRRRLPRPGPWMQRFRRWMALPMALTTLALLWLALRLGGQGFALLAALLAVGLAAALVAAGRRQRRGVAATPIIAPALLAVAVVAVGVLPRIAETASAAVDSILPTQPFSDAALAEARATGRPVFAYFTADWCLTCKVNEQVAIERAETRDAFARAGVIVLRGDWTRRDPAITRFLTARAAAGVPLYLWYPAGGADARQLPQVLTPAMLADLPGT